MLFQYRLIPFGLEVVLKVLSDFVESGDGLFLVCFVFDVACAAQFFI